MPDARADDLSGLAQQTSVYVRFGATSAEYRPKTGVFGAIRIEFDIERGCGMNRTKALVLGLFAVYWAFVVVLLVAARNLYDGLLPQ